MTTALEPKKDEVLVIGGQVFNKVFFSYMRDILEQNAGSASNNVLWPSVTVVDPQLDDEISKKKFKIAIIEVCERRLAEHWSRCEYVRANHPSCQIVIVFATDSFQLQSMHMLQILPGIHFCDGIGEAIVHVWQSFNQPVM